MLVTGEEDDLCWPLLGKPASNTHSFWKGPSRADLRGYTAVVPIGGKQDTGLHSTKLDPPGFSFVSDLQTRAYA